MLLLFGNDRPEYLQAVYQLETMRTDLVKMKVDLERIQIKRKLAEADLNLTDSTLEYLRLYAKTVSLREFQRVKFQKVSAIEAYLNASRSVPVVEKQIRLTEEAVEKLERNIPSLKFKLLEFKKRD
jgi:hypothetical protein